MTIRVAVAHHTTYRFDRPIGIGPHVIRLRPAPHCRTRIDSYSLRVEPADHFINWQQDPFGNHLARLVFPEPADELSIAVDLTADLTVINPFDFFLEDDAEHAPFAYEPLVRRDLAPYLQVDDAGPLLDDFVASVRPPAGTTPRTVDLLVDVNRRVFETVAYTTRMEPGVQTPDETLEKARGSCRDSGWLLVQVMRGLGFAARFVSGYLVQLRADEAPLDGPAGPAADFTDLHAWCEVYLPGAGWVGLDPTSGLFAGEGHLPLCCTPHPATAAPVTGTTDPTEVTSEFTNSVTRVHEDPRVTLPYTDVQWAAIDQLARRVDDELARGDVRLTMGGEPTFVSIDDLSSEQWTTDADGDDKRRLAWQLTQRLADRFAHGPLLHHGQGKWYPGEPLPRWQMGIWWRTDGVALWRDRTLLADPYQPGGQTIEDARAVALAVARTFGIGDGFVHPAYEDPIHDVWEEARRPAGPPPADLDPTDPTLATDAGRAAARVELADRRTGAATGYVLPLAANGDGSWGTSRWTFRRGRLILVPGDSPIGLRLPLSSLAWTAPPPVFERSNFEPRGPLPAPTAEGVASASTFATAPGGVAPTAFCTELRDGRVHVFLPPLERADDAVELLGAIEAAAARLGVPVVVEGYPPPSDERLRQLSVTPDPGVIEVNVPPAVDWDDLVDITTAVHAEARECRLGTERFDLDGAHWGTGGGNHMTIGGPTAADSPVLRRPDLLASLVTYWQHHPSLSYLFSGRFVGPTSQAPRVDEARVDLLDELEIALGEVDRLGGPEARPWIVDRMFRNLLTDGTGNTHRAEFCIDKLFDPGSERGRMGLVELRAFEMPPHPRMALVQALLVRSIIARMWAEPYRHDLVRWGTELHDRFLLPHEVACDAAEVVDDLRAHGIAFEHAWLDPFVEFRFPRLGEVVINSVHLELRAAIEPWLVLGEESTAGGTARYVDSSLERLQVLAEGYVDGRHVVTCNGRPVPVRPVRGAPDLRVGGVRYRAWQPPTALHPTIGVHSPLVFEVIDRWNRRSLGGCTYHVVHPGGRAYDTFPVNAAEAESRRASRFEPFGQVPGAADAATDAALAATPTGGRYPRTLDLRQARPS